LIPDFTPSPNQAGALLAVAIALEVAGTVCLRLSEGSTRWLPSLLVAFFYVLSFGINGFVVRTLGLRVVGVVGLHASVLR
jgi:small multidrug resistance pump